MDDRPKILIIDDEEVVLDSCAQIVEGSHYQAVTASDGTLGLKLVQELQPDLIFVDLKMPGVSGFEVLEKVNEIDPTIVTVVITGYATVSSAVEAMKKGAYDFLPKPFTPDEFRLITRRGLEKRRLELETIALRREKEMLREHFAAIVSHELRAPLNAVQQNLFVFDQELSGKLTEDQKARLERIKSRIDDLLKLVRSWLRVVSVDMGKLKEGFAPVSVIASISKAIESVEPYAVRKDIEIVISINDRLRPIEGDSVTLTEALVNIIGNAVKYSYEGSKVLVRAEEKADHILITVSDTGAGIPREDLPHLFEGFYRGKSGQAVEEGHGLGLALSRRIIEAHNGTISVESELGAGSTFVVSLPALRAQPTPQGG